MVKVKGPMMSLGATGTLAGAITFGSWKGRPCVRERVTPSNPKSGGQVGRRAMFTFLSKAWAALSSADKATWQALADQLVALPSNAYIAYNMDRWHNFLTPAQANPAAQVNASSDRNLSGAVWEENRIKLSSTATTANEQWGLIIFAKLAGAVTPAVGNAIIVELDEDVANRDTYWTPPSLGRWYFNSIPFSDDGVQDVAGIPVDTGP